MQATLIHAQTQPVTSRHAFLERSQMPFTPRELEIKHKIERSRLNPKHVSAKKWIETSTVSLADLARKFCCSNTIMATLSRKLGVKRNLKAGVVPASAGTNGQRKSDLGTITTEKQRCTKLLKAARGNDPHNAKLAKVELEKKFGIRFV